MTTKTSKMQDSKSNCHNNSKKSIYFKKKTFTYSQWSSNYNYKYQIYSRETSNSTNNSSQLSYNSGVIFNHQSTKWTINLLSTKRKSCSSNLNYPSFKIRSRNLHIKTHISHNLWIRKIPNYKLSKISYHLLRKKCSKINKSTISIKTKCWSNPIHSMTESGNSKAYFKLNSSN